MRQFNQQWLIGSAIFVWGTRIAYEYATTATAVGTTAAGGMLAYLILGVVLTAASTSMFVSAINEQVQVDLIDEYET